MEGASEMYDVILQLPRSRVDLFPVMPCQGSGFESHPGHDHLCFLELILFDSGLYIAKQHLSNYSLQFAFPGEKMKWVI